MRLSKKALLLTLSITMTFPFPVFASTFIEEPTDFEFTLDEIPEEKETNKYGTLPPASVQAEINAGTRTLNKTRATSGSWIALGSKWKFRYTNNTYAVNKWEQVGDRWYHFDGSGYMQTGWFQDSDKKWYYLQPNDGFMRVSWIEVNGKWYYLNGSGVMQIGWLTLSGKTYYLKSDGAMISNTWHSIYDIPLHKELDFKFNASGHLIDTPSNRSVVYGFDHGSGDWNTQTIVKNVTTKMSTIGYTATSRLQVPATDPIQPYGTDLKNRLDSGLFLISSHAGTGFIAFVDGNDKNAKSYLSGTRQNGAFYKIQGNSMKNCRIAVFAGCETAITDANETATYNCGNLLTTSVKEGASSALGFKEKGYTRSYDIFVPRLITGLTGGSTIRSAIDYALAGLPPYDLVHNYVLVGDQNTKLALTRTTKTSLKPSYLYLSEEDKLNYILKYEYTDTNIYIKIVEGIETSDSYTCDKEGNIISIRNNINDIDENKINDIKVELYSSPKTKSRSINQVQIEPFIEYNGIIFDKITDVRTLDTIEKIKDEVYYIRITYIDYENSEGLGYQDIKVINLSNGEIISYDDILAEYTQ